MRMGKHNPVEAIGQFEAWALTAVLSLGEGHAYGMTVHRELERLSGKKFVSLGAVYTTLDRLEKKGMVRSRIEEPHPVRGGRVRKFFAIEGPGVAALNAFVEQAGVAKSILSLNGAMAPST